MFGLSSLRGLIRLREKASFLARSSESNPQGLKPTLILIGFMPGINPRPTARASVSAGAKADLLHWLYRSD